MLVCDYCKQEIQCDILGIDVCSECVNSLPTFLKDPIAVKLFGALKKVEDEQAKEDYEILAERDSKKVAEQDRKPEQSESQFPFAFVDVKLATGAEIAKRLSDTAKERKFSKVKLSELTGIPSSSICHFLKGNRDSFSFDRIRKLADAMGVNFIDIIKQGNKTNTDDRREKLLKEVDCIKWELNEMNDTPDEQAKLQKRLDSLYEQLVQLNIELGE